MCGTGNDMEITLNKNQGIRLENMMKENMELKQALNNRGRLSAPPLYPSHSTWAPPPPPPLPRPTVQQNGYEEIEAVKPAQAVAKSIMAQFMPQQ